MFNFVCQERFSWWNAQLCLSGTLFKALTIYFVCQKILFNPKLKQIRQSVMLFQVQTSNFAVRTPFSSSNIQICLSGTLFQVQMIRFVCQERFFKSSNDPLCLSGTLLRVCMPNFVWQERFSMFKHPTLSVWSWSFFEKPFKLCLPFYYLFLMELLFSFGC